MQNLHSALRLFGHHDHRHKTLAVVALQSINKHALELAARARKVIREYGSEPIDHTPYVKLISDDK